LYRKITLLYRSTPYSTKSLLAQPARPLQTISRGALPIQACLAKPCDTGTGPAASRRILTCLPYLVLSPQVEHCRSVPYRVWSCPPYFASPDRSVPDPTPPVLVMPALLCRSRPDPAVRTTPSLPKYKPGHACQDIKPASATKQISGSGPSINL
jgi:hypothetical protein